MGKLRIATIRDEFLRAFQPLECLVEESEFLGQTRLILSISHAHKVVLQVQPFLSKKLPSHGVLQCSFKKPATSSKPAAFG